MDKKSRVHSDVEGKIWLEKCPKSVVFLVKVPNVFLAVDLEIMFAI